MVGRAGNARVLYTPPERNSKYNFLAIVIYKGDES
jgi:hypothetical protein